MLAVEHDERATGKDRARYLGVVQGISLQDKAIADIKMDDISWVEASWYVSQEDEAIWNSDGRQYSVSTYQDRFERPVIYVRDPYQIGEEPSLWRDESFVRVYGHLNIGENTDGWRRFDLCAENEKPGESHTTLHSLQPYIDGRKFNLPLWSGGYLIEPMDNIYCVQWVH